MCAFLPMSVDGSMVWQLHRRQAAADAALLCTAQRLGSETGKRDHTRGAMIGGAVVVIGLSLAEKFCGVVIA